MGQLTEKQEIKKHIATIHCSNTLTLLQRKISNALLYFAYPHLNEREEHEITIKQLCNIIGYNGNNHKAIKDSLKGMLSVIIEWDVIDQMTGEEDWTASTILASVRIKGSLCQYAYSPRMRNLLYSPLMYGKINLIVQSRFNSNYGLALYENCVRYKGLPYTKWFDLDLFRKLMGVPAGTYDIFRDMKKRVIDKAVEEVNSFSDMIIEYEIKRSGKKVTQLRFKLKIKEKKKIIGINRAGECEGVKLATPANEPPLIYKLRNIFGLTTSQIEQIQEDYSEELINEKISYIESSKYKIVNLAAYLLHSLKNNYQKPVSNETIKETQTQENEKNSQKEKSLERQKEMMQKRYSKYVEENCDAFFSGLSDNIKEEFYGLFEKYLQDSHDQFTLIKYRKEGLDNRIVKSIFRNFIKKQFPDVAYHLITYDEFLLQKMEQEN